ncbi:MAG: hypothetical protein P4M09_20720 [Devosia sp.]|nr:hypothetical protein [Devosia sp.]
MTERQEEPGRAVAANDDFAGWARGDSGGVRSGADVGAQISFDAMFALSSIAESLVDGFVGAKPDPNPRHVEPDRPRPDPFQRAAEEARQNAAREKETSDRKWYEEEWSWSRTRD